MLTGSLCFKVELQHPEEEWKLVNAWFVKQHFRAKFNRREIIQADEKTAA